MSQETKFSKITIPDLQKMYKIGDKITMLTAYDATMAKLVDQAGVEVILVGDSLGMVVQGYENTLRVSIEDMVYHTKCVAQVVKRAHIMADMPFMSYQASHEEAVINAGALIKAGAGSVKIEGGEEMADLIWYLNKVGVPVMGHIGLKPQNVHVMGGYKIQGKTKADAENIISDAQILEEAGAFGLLIEGVPVEVAQKVQQSIHIPLIGIGSGLYCDGQVLVIYDLLGTDPDFNPSFVKKYMNLFEQSQKSIGQYIKDVKKGTFPSDDNAVHRNLLMLQGGDEPSEKSGVLKAVKAKKEISKAKSKKKK